MTNEFGTSNQPSRPKLGITSIVTFVVSRFQRWFFAALPSQGIHTFCFVPLAFKNMLLLSSDLGGSFGDRNYVVASRNQPPISAECLCDKMSTKCDPFSGFVAVTTRVVDTSSTSSGCLRPKIDLEKQVWVEVRHRYDHLGQPPGIGLRLDSLNNVRTLRTHMKQETTVRIHGSDWKLADVEDAVAFCREHQWRREPWVRRDALVQRTGTTSLYTGQRYSKFRGS